MEGLRDKPEAGAGQKGGKYLILASILMPDTNHVPWLFPGSALAQNHSDGKIGTAVT